MDFYEIKTRNPKKGLVEVYPDFKVCRSKDLMIRGKSFYAIWDESAGMWSTDEHEVQKIVDADLWAYADRMDRGEDCRVSVKTMSSFSSASWLSFEKYLRNMPDNAHQLDERLTFADTEVKKTDYVSKRLGYSLSDAPCPAWEELISTLYDPGEREKLEWSIGAIVSGDARKIQKFVVLYGAMGTGKSTVIDIIQKLFDGYYTAFEAKALGSSSNTFSTEVFKTNPLVAIQHDGDLSRIEDNTKLNSIVSHEMMTMHEKYKPDYMARANCFLFLGTNHPVKITDAKSGIIRRLIDIEPTGKLLPPKRYSALMSQIEFELGSIAKHCLDVYHELGKNYYQTYRPLKMIYKTDVFFNFVEDCYLSFASAGATTLKAAYEMYKDYCEESGTESIRLPKYKFREELKNYFESFQEVTRVDGKQIRSYYSGFLKDKFKNRVEEPKEEEHPYSLVLEETHSLMDDAFADCRAQYANDSEGINIPWADVTTCLKDLDTTQLHYLKTPDNVVMVDFDLRGKDGQKDPERNLAAASEWPATYAEWSKGGAGIHLVYYYEGDLNELSRIHSEGVEIKPMNKGNSMRRRLIRCNNIPIATLRDGQLPKKEKKMVNFEAIKDEKMLRNLIAKNLRKEILPHTRESVNLIYKDLETAYASGMKYDVTDLRPKIQAFANNSTNSSAYCTRLAAQMRFRSEEPSEASTEYDDDRLVFFDVEVFPNLFLLNWKYQGIQMRCVRMINPTPVDLEPLMHKKLVGFNCRRYDNHIVYARYIGKSNEELYQLSQRIISGSQNALFSEAYSLSYTDVYDFAKTKQSLKKWEIELGIHHQELGLPWDQPVPEERWNQVAEYCDNDVLATEAVFNACQADWTARKILAGLSGLTVNDTTNQHTTRIVFGRDRRPQGRFNYRFMGIDPGAAETYTTLDMAKEPAWSIFDSQGRPVFPGYTYDHGKSTYRGEEVGEGGYVYAEPGAYENVALLDIASMHPSTIVAEKLFGEEYTARFKDILDARILIKHRDFEKARTILGGKLAPFLNDEGQADDLASALKIAINSVYGLTAAKFDNAFRDVRNVDNIVAKRGALFMVNLKHEVQARGFTVAHIKTDSIKIPNATPEIIDFVTAYGKAYGYSFEHESTYDRMCLVNDAVYVAHVQSGKHAGQWVAVGAQFQHPYIFKKFFSKEPIDFRDLCETKTVSTAMYLDMNEGLPEDQHRYHFVGKAGSFVPVLPGTGGGVLVRENGKGGYDSVTGAKGYRWLEAEAVSMLARQWSVDMSYYRKLSDKAVDAISEHTDFERFTTDNLDESPAPNDPAPWRPPCGDARYAFCFDCPNYHPELKTNLCDAGYNLSASIKESEDIHDYECHH